MTKKVKAPTEARIVYATVMATVDGKNAVTRVLLPEHALPDEIHRATRDACDRAVMAAVHKAGHSPLWDGYQIEDPRDPSLLRLVRAAPHISSTAVELGPVCVYSVDVTRHCGPSKLAVAEAERLAAEQTAWHEAEY